MQDSVDDAWRGQSSSSHFDINLPSEIDKVCFANLSATITNRGEDYEFIKDFYVYEANVFLIPLEKARVWNGSGLTILISLKLVM